MGLPQTAIKSGIEKARWPARLELMGHTQPDNGTHTPLYFDSGHNVPCAVALKTQIQKWQQDKCVHVIIGIAANKDTSGFISCLYEIADSTALVDLPAAIAPSKAADHLKKLPENIKPSIHKTLEKAIEGKDGLILVCGSLYLYKAIINLENLTRI